MSRAVEVTIIRNPEETLVFATPVEWAVRHLAGVLTSCGLTVHTGDSAPAGIMARLHIHIATAQDKAAAEALDLAGIEHPQGPESFGIVNRAESGASILTVVGIDAAGLVYALTDLADVAQCSTDPLRALCSVPSRSERPVNAVRSITRLFTSEPEDKPWFYDRSFWDEYLTEMAAQRFNRFTFSVGCGYDYLIDKIVMDNYFCFFYPFVLDVPGYKVRVEGLPAEERDRNLDMLRYIGQCCRERGLEFRLGLWNHSYDYGPQNTHGKYRILGIDASNHTAYCRDALAALLQACPEIGGLTFRVHFEGGVPEPTHAFWRTVMERIGEAENLIDIDFHSKGVTDELLEILQGTGKRFVLSTKFWGEHMGPPYHQASIRAREFYGGTRVDAANSRTSATPSTGHHETDVRGTETTQRRSFTRYGYADFLSHDPALRDRPPGVAGHPADPDLGGSGDGGRDRPQRRRLLRVAGLRVV